MSDIEIRNAQTPEPVEDRADTRRRRSRRLRRTETTITADGTYSSNGVFTPYPPRAAARSTQLKSESTSTSSSDEKSISAGSSSGNLLAVEEKDAEKQPDYFSMLMRLDEDMFGADGPGLTAEEIKSILIYCRTCQRYMTKRTFSCEYTHMKKCLASKDSD